VTHEPKKSDLAVVAVKPTNNAGSTPAAEPVEPRAGAEGNVGQQSTHRTQFRARVSQALARVRQAAKGKEAPLPHAALRRQPPEVGAECVNRACSDLCGGGQQWASLPRTE